MTTPRLYAAPVQAKPDGILAPAYALSVRQPWAWLIVNGYKPIENRDWRTNIRGRILIHASAGMTRDEWFAACLFMGGFSWGPGLISKLPDYEFLQRGGIVGEATILDCVSHHESDWFTGRYGFVLADARQLPFRPLDGRQKFFRVHEVAA